MLITLNKRTGTTNPRLRDESFKTSNHKTIINVLLEGLFCTDESIDTHWMTLL